MILFYEPLLIIKCLIRVYITLNFSITSRKYFPLDLVPKSLNCYLRNKTMENVNPLPGSQEKLEAVLPGPHQGRWVHKAVLQDT